MRLKEVTVCGSSQYGITEIDACSYNFTIKVPTETYAQWLLAQETWLRVKREIHSTAIEQGKLHE